MAIQEKIIFCKELKNMKFIKSVLFNRITLIVTAILIQLLVLIGIIFRFNDRFVFFYGVFIVIGIILVAGIVNNNTNPAYKIAWIIPILLFPIFGGMFYIFFGGNKTSKRAKNKMKQIIDKTQISLSVQDLILEEMEVKNKTAAIQSRYIQKYAYSPLYKNTLNEYFPVGESKFEKLKDELKKAESFIFMEYFIIEEGIMWNSILDILKKKVSEGLDVRVIYDDAGCLFKLPSGYNKKLEEMGIKCCIFNPIIPVLSARYNNRDHRKITIIDGHTGFTGGINLADEYINAINIFGHWKDSAIMLKGDAVWSMTVMFLSMWDYIRGIDEDFEKFKYTKGFQNNPEASKGYVQPFSSGPLRGEAVGEIVYLNIINKARDYVYITTPYLIIDNEMFTALSSAAKGGVDIKIITPYRGDNKYIHALTRSYYRILIENGVKIYEYTPGFIHAKNYLSDDNYGVVGTINMDFRSLYLHFECGVWMYNCNSLLEMKNDFINTLNSCRAITTKDIDDIKWYRAIPSSILRVFAPLL